MVTDIVGLGCFSIREKVILSRLNGKVERSSCERNWWMSQASTRHPSELPDAENPDHALALCGERVSSRLAAGVLIRAFVQSDKFKSLIAHQYRASNPMSLPLVRQLDQSNRGCSLLITVDSKFHVPSVEVVTSREFSGSGSTFFGSTQEHLLKIRKRPADN